MLQFNNFLTLVRKCRKAFYLDSEGIEILSVSITDLRLNIDLLITTKLSPAIEIKTSLTISTSSDGKVTTKIQGGTYDALTISLIEYVSLVMRNRVYDLLQSIEAAKSEVLNDE